MLSILLQKQTLVRSKEPFPGRGGAETAQGLLAVPGSFWGIKGRLSLLGLGLFANALAFLHCKQEGMSELSGGGEYRWSLAEGEGSANQRRLASSIRTEQMGLRQPGGALPSLPKCV